MLFKFPKKKIVLNCFTSKAYVIEYAPIHFAIKYMPEWWKNLPKSYEDPIFKNMRNCVGMVDYYKKSVAIPMWCDLLVETHGNKMFQWQYADFQSEARQHSAEQSHGFLNDYQHLKLESPWRFVSEKGLHWVWSHPTYNYPFSSDIACLPGITDFYYQHTTNVNIMILANEKKKILIKQAQPIVLMTPMSDRKVEVVRHLVDEKEIKRIDDKTTSISFSHKYKTIIKRKEQFKDCPYHKE